MSDFKFPCPKCGQSIACDTSNAGMNVSCPHCQAAITVPKAPEPEPVPGKLAIRHSPPAPSAPPPGTANAPKPTSWGSRPPAPPPPKKKAAWIMPVVVSGIVLAVLAAGWFFVGAPMRQKRADEEKHKQEVLEQQQRDQEAAAAAAKAAKEAKAKIVWTLDPAAAEIPQFPASGKLHGVNFKVETALIQNGSLLLRQDSGSSRQFIIAIPVKPPLAGKSFESAPNETNRPPLVEMVWKEEGGKAPGVGKFTKDYVLKLQFGEVDSNGNTPGGIYLAVHDPEQSFVAGTFLAAPKLLPGQPKPVPAAPPPGKKRK